MAKIKSPSLLDVAKGLKRHRKSTWVDYLSPDMVKQLTDLRAAYQNKELNSLSLRQLHREVIQAAGLDIGLSAFSAWMRAQ